MLSWRFHVPTAWWVVVAVLGSAGSLVLVRLVLLVRELETAESAARRAQERLAHLATHDELTGLPNRRLLMDRLETAVENSARQGTRVGVVYLDLDLFKPTNDVLGHAAGDAVLVEVARRLSGAVRDGDTVARMGGDEFVVALPGLSGPQEAQAVANSLVAVLSADHVWNGNTVPGGASAGVTVVDPTDSSPEDAVCRADEALGAVKRGGRGRVLLAGGGPGTDPGPVARPA